MSDEAVTLARRAVELFNEQGADVDAAEPTPPGIYATEPEIVPIRAALEGVTYTGPTALDDFWNATRESWTRVHIDLDSLEPVGGGALGLGTLTATSRDTGAEVRSRVAFAVHVRDGVISRNAAHLTEQAARRDLLGG